MKNTKTTIREFFKKEYLDSKKIKTSFLQKWQGKTHGQSPTGVSYVTVGDLTFDYNGRRPKANTIMKYIEESNGLDWYLFGACQIAKVNGTDDLWDTLHRAIIACVVLGPDAKVPAITTTFDSGEKVHATFWKANGGQAKTVSPEQSFIAQVKSKEPKPEADQVAQLLRKTKDVVIFEDVEVYEPSTNTTDWQVKYGPCRQMLLDIKETAYILEGFNTYKLCFEQTYQGNKPYNIMGQILQALSFIHKCEKDFLKNNCKNVQNIEHFRDWLKQSVSVRCDKAKHWLYKEHFHDRMEKRYLGTAFGIWSDFVTWFSKNVTNSGGSRAKLDKIEKAYYGSLEKYGKKAA